MSLISLLSKIRNFREYMAKGGLARVEKIVVSKGELLKNRRIVITGGSSGIGLAMAKRFLEEGARVVITGRDYDRLEAVQKTINNENLSVLVWDIGNTVLAKVKIPECEKLLRGSIDVFINNAGISYRQAAQDLTEKAWESVLSVNLTGNVFAGKEMCNRWVEKHAKGILLNISSNAGVKSVVDAYGASKAALIKLTEGWAKVYAKYGIRVNAIAPGIIIGTNINTLQRSVSEEGNLHTEYCPDKRFGVPSEIAEVALFLVSDMSSYIYGQTIVVDGGAAL